MKSRFYEILLSFSDGFVINVTLQVLASNTIYRGHSNYDLQDSAIGVNFQVWEIECLVDN